uniref:Uncharacterized protein n=1 Tax=Globodera rostochiensis TaxID=31243 RepID=A0A914I1Z6_GLORO
MDEEKYVANVFFQYKYLVRDPMVKMYPNKLKALEPLQDPCEEAKLKVKKTHRSLSSSSSWCMNNSAMQTIWQRKSHHHRDDQLGILHVFAHRRTAGTLLITFIPFNKPPTLLHPIPPISTSDHFTHLFFFPLVVVQDGSLRNKSSIVGNLDLELKPLQDPCEEAKLKVKKIEKIIIIGMIISKIE